MVIKLNFVKVNPVENMTIFILDQVPRYMQIDIAKKLMNYNSICAEQVGFIEKVSIHKELEDSGLRLQMMGGEFCPNASRSLAALLVHNEYPYIIKQDDNTYLVKLEASGVEDILECEVHKTDNPNTYLSKINMPLPVSIEDFNYKKDKFSVEGVKVEFLGITHFVVNDKDENNRETIFEIIREQLDDKIYEAFGIMYYDFENEYVNPLVYVKATDSLFWEKSCASGTCALGIALSYINKKSIIKNIKQPGGEIEVSTHWNNDFIEKIYLNASVQIVAEGIVNI